MELAIEYILNDMYEDIKNSIKEHQYKAFVAINDLFIIEDMNINAKLDAIKNIESVEVRELLYEHYISNLATDLFYERTRKL